MTEEYQAPYDVFKMAYDEIRAALMKIAMTGKYEDAALVPALLAVAAGVAILADSSDEEIIEEFKKCLFDARTRKTQENPQ